jgi:hypothetical protein
MTLERSSIQFYRDRPFARRVWFSLFVVVKLVLGEAVLIPDFI